MNCRQILLIIVVVLACGAGVFGQKNTAPAPKLINMPEPVFAEDGVALGFGGKIRVYVDVDRSGKPKVTGVAGPIAPCSDQGDERIRRLREAAIESAKVAVFEPAMVNNKPADSVATITFNVPHPKLSESEQGSPKYIEAGIVSGRAVSLPKPEYPRLARGAGARGAVTVQVFINDEGKVSGAGALSGHPDLQQAAVKAACNAKFSPTILRGKHIIVSGILIYNFVP
jgi:TonB family protein